MRSVRFLVPLSSALCLYKAITPTNTVPVHLRLGLVKLQENLVSLHLVSELKSFFLDGCDSWDSMVAAWSKLLG